MLNLLVHHFTSRLLKVKKKSSFVPSGVPADFIQMTHPATF
jgi:hypothetical protein